MGMLLAAMCLEHGDVCICQRLCLRFLHMRVAIHSATRRECVSAQAVGVWSTQHQLFTHTHTHIQLHTHTHIHPRLPASPGLVVGVTSLPPTCLTRMQPSSTPTGRPCVTGTALISTQSKRRGVTSESDKLCGRGGDKVEKGGGVG